MSQVLHFRLCSPEGAISVAVGETHAWQGVKQHPALKGPDRRGQPVG